MLTGLVLIFIAIFDFMWHRIPNISLLILLIATLVSGSVTVLPLYALIALVVSLLAYRYCGLGAGDVKLLIIITLFMTPQDQIADFWFYFSPMAYLFLPYISPSLGQSKAISLSLLLCVAQFSVFHGCT
jgi:Flp pilus assembly protein protease CpaA